MVKEIAMKNKFFLSAISGLLFTAVVGCSSGGGLHSAYIVPRIEGRVIDVDTQLPIRRVVVLRNPQATVAGNDDYLSAGEIQQKQHSIYSGKDGVFKVPSKKDLEIGSDKTWNSVTLKFTHPGYHMFSTNFVHSGGSSEEGEPVLQTGDIVLRPLPAHIDESK